ncbi:MAG: hypothetical protein ABI388_07870 [Bacteroidia bacterium]
MKIKNIISLLAFFTTTSLMAQITTKVETGVITNVQAKFLGAQSLTVNKIELVLMANQEDTTNSTFLINKEYANLLIKTDSNKSFALNPKYKGKALSFSYFVNGKGWNCISKITPLRITPKKMSKETLNSQPKTLTNEKKLQQH